MSEVHQNQALASATKPPGSRSIDVAVIGGGIVGKAVALGLAQLGLQTLEVAPGLDHTIPNPSGSEWGQRIYAFSPGTVSLLKHLQVWDAVDHSRLQVVKDMRIYGDRGERADQLHLSAFEAGVSELAWIGESGVIEHTLDTASRFQNKLERLSASISEIHVDEGGVQLQLENGKSIFAQLVIAADGANSFIRSAIGIETTEESYEQNAVVANWQCTQSHLQTAYQWFLPGGDIIAMLPLPNQQVSMVWSTSNSHAAHLLELSQSEWGRQFSEIANGAILQQLGALTLHSQPTSFPLRKMRAERLIGPPDDPKVVLLGDAAHVIHPLAGQGLNLGLRDVAALLNVLGKRESFRSINDFNLLRRYERERQGDTSALLWVTDKLKKLFSGSSNTERFARNFGLGLVNKSHFLKQRLIQQALGDSNLE
ncbi:FAD-dependent monooxygenase [Polynucleobacter paludilacus]|uniref:FAD-dependent monooxygenase n=1 Tax=Polynucleobacter paludilacus TaxID=1855895 RepID=UPI001BFEDC25|nr:FAD-dependent monooxygenase [Polynucleobacter paludilacus]QWD87144.1 FAD-dependent monooxygenase [Polynucleobacter paludilacus]